MSVFIVALGLLLSAEGLLYALAPDFMKRMAARLLGTERDQLRQSGIIAATLGAILIYISARFMR